MDRYTDQETILAERYVSVLDYVSRCAQAVEQGDWHYLWDKAGSLREAAARLDECLATGLDADGARGFRSPTVRSAAVRAAVAEWGRHYAAGRALHPLGGAR